MSHDILLRIAKPVDPQIVHFCFTSCTCMQIMFAVDRKDVIARLEGPINLSKEVQIRVTTHTKLLVIVTTKC